MRRTALIVLVIVFAGCATTSPNAWTSAPAGVNQSIWNDYCARGASLVSYLQQQENGTLTTNEFVAKLNGSQNGIASDATATRGLFGVKFRAVADSIGRLTVAVGHRAPDYSKLLTASGALPSCR